LAAVRG